MGLHCGHSELYSATWPASGSMRNGAVSKRPRSALPTPAAASSSTPGPLLSTPVASDGGTDRGSSAGWGLRDEARKLLPTPRTSDTNGAGQHGDGGMDLRTAVTLLPTPAASFPGTTANFRPDGTPYGTGYGKTLLDAVRLLPTPTATPYGNNQTDSPNAAVRPSMESPAPTLLPTPRARDSKGRGYGDDLPSQAGLLLPTPRATRGGSATETMYELGAERTDAGRPQGEVLLPTPTASDGERTSSTYGRGNPTLTGAITDPPSDAGNPSSVAPPPGPLTLWDDWYPSSPNG
jgi:hypothetical protein